MHKNLIYLCASNNTSVEFFRDYFQTKDKSTGSILLQGQNNNGIYEWQTLSHLNNKSPSPSCFVVKVDDCAWHQHLGHPPAEIQQLILHHFQLSSSSTFNFQSCSSCLWNKSHILPFGTSFLKSKRPLDLIYSLFPFLIITNII